jgi:hypothetical protein
MASDHGALMDVETTVYEVLLQNIASNSAETYYSVNNYSK